jgi:hypothetical protein
VKLEHITAITFTKFAAARGDAVKNWVEAKGYITSSGSITGNAATATNATNHIANTSNPHKVTAAQVGALSTSATANSLKRIFKQGYTGGAYWYFPICTLPVNDAGNYASCILFGRIGGCVKYNMSYINALLSNRDGAYGAFIQVGAIADGALGVTDIVIYTQTDNTAIVYLKAKDYYAFDLNINTYQDSVSYTWDGNYTTSPSGTLAWAASSGENKLQVSGSKGYVGGKELALKEDTIVSATLTEV